MAVPAFSPAGGVGSQTTSGGVTYQFGTGGWTPVASSASAPMASTKPVTPAKTTTTTSTTKPTATVATQQQPAQPAFYSGNMPTGPSADEMAQIESAYGSGMDYLSQVEGRLRPEYQSALQEAESIYGTQAQALGGQKQQAQTQLQEQATKGQQAYESALAQARQTYEQLQRGYQQRFGGASSAGQAASEIANVERLRQQGANYRTLQDVNRQVQAGLQSVDQQYNQSLLQLEQNKIAAQNQARRDFNDKLSQIDAQRAQLGQNKAAQKLQALQNLRQQVLQIEAENRNFQNTLTLQREQARQALETYKAQLSAGAGATVATTNQKITDLARSYANPNLTPQDKTNILSQVNTLIGQANLNQSQRDYYKSLFGQQAGQ